jgi:hypothetical protein
MSEAAGNAKRGMLRLSSWILGSILSMLGVVSSGCNNSAEPTYGPPSVAIRLFGTTMSSADSATVAGIEVSALSTDSTALYSSNLTDSEGNYVLDLMLYYPWPDTLLVTASDIDGAQNGSFLNADTLIFPPGEMSFVEIETDFYMEPEEK